MRTVSMLQVTLFLALATALVRPSPGHAQELNVAVCAIDGLHPLGVGQNKAPLNVWLTTQGVVTTDATQKVQTLAQKLAWASTASVDADSKEVKKGTCSPLFANETHVDVRIGKGHALVLWVDDGSPPMNLGVTEVGFSSRSGEIEPHKFESGESPHTYLVVPLDRVYRQFTHGDVVRVQVRTSKQDAPTIAEGFFGVYEPVSPYAIKDAPTAIWFPVGLFATNFKSKENGIPFSAMPVGVAVGGRYHWATWDGLRQGYIGLSAFAAYTVAVTQKANADARDAESDDEKKDFTLSALSLGPLVDISGWAYVGMAYTLDLRKDHNNPGTQMVVGLGSNFLKLLGNTN